MTKLTVIVPVRSAESYEIVRKNLEGIHKDELIVVEGRNPSRQRNEGVKSSEGEIIYFIDDDSKPVKESIEKALLEFEQSPDTDVIGGPCITPQSDTFLQKCFGAVFSSIFAAGSSRARYIRAGRRRESGEKELILCNMFVRKSAFESAGGLREELYPNEENEFLNRLKKTGGKIIYDPDIYVERSQRKSLGEFIRQCFRYGRGRAEQMKLNLNISDALNMIPLLFASYLASLFFLKNHEAAFAPLAVYGVLACFFAAEASFRLKKAACFVCTLALFPVLHLSYAAGTAAGILFSNPAVRKRPEDITIKKGSMK